MKTTIYILAALFAMNLTLPAAGNPGIIIVKANVRTYNTALHNAELAPVTPKEAFFNDIEPRPATEISRLAPITPKEATFEDIQAEFNIQSINPLVLQKILPETPKEAEFEDPAPEQITGIDSLAPISHIAATFEE